MAAGGYGVGVIREQCGSARESSDKVVQPAPALVPRTFLLALPPPPLMDSLPVIESFLSPRRRCEQASERVDYARGVSR